MNNEQNSLSLLNYRFKLSRTPEVEYRAQSVSLPGVSLGSVSVPTQLGLRSPMTGDIDYEDLSIQFLVGERLKDYLEIQNWMVQLGHPDRLRDYPKDLKQAFSDVSVLILNSAMAPIINCRFTDAFPISISSLEFDSTMTDVQYATATVTFRYNRYAFIEI